MKFDIVFTFSKKICSPIREVLSLFMKVSFVRPVFLTRQHVRSTQEIVSMQKQTKGREGAVFIQVIFHNFLRN